MENKEKRDILNLRDIRRKLKPERSEAEIVYPQKEKLTESFRANSNLGKKPEKFSSSASSYNSSENISRIMERLISYILYLLIFSLPLFILPFSVEIYEFNKTLLLFFLSSLAFFLWMVKMVAADRKIIIVKTPINVFLIILILAVSISTLLSIDKVSSILGFYGRFSDSMLVYLSLVMFFFVSVNHMSLEAVEKNRSGKTGEDLKYFDHFKSGEARNSFLKALLASSFLVVSASVLYAFNLKFIPWSEAQFRAFNLVGGSPYVLGVYLTSIILIAIYFRGATASVFSKHLMSGLVIISLALLAFIDFILAWIILAVSLAFVLALSFIFKAKSGEKEISESRSYALSFLVLVVSIIFIISSLSFINKGGESSFQSSLISVSIKNRLISNQSEEAVSGGWFNKEAILDKKTATSIIFNGLKRDPVMAIAGTGPGTYLYSFSKFKSAEFNSGPFWNIRFDKAGSEILEKISTIGVLGTLFYLLIIALTALMAFKLIAYLENNFAYIIAAWFGLLLFQFLYLESTATKFLFWALTAIIIAEYLASSGSKAIFWTMDLSHKRGKPIGQFALLAAFLLLFTVSYYYLFQFYQAEAEYKNAILVQGKELAKNNLSDQQISDVLNRSINELEKAAAKNPYRGNYKTYLSDVYLFKLNFTLKEESAKNENERDNQHVALEIKSAIDFIKSAADLSPNNIIFQNKLADVYLVAFRDLGVSGADEWAIKKYEKAVELDPNNPALYVSLGNTYFLQYKKLKSEDKIDQAISRFRKALELKKDYIDAGLGLSLSYEAKGDDQSAISALESLGSMERIEKAIAQGIVVSGAKDLDIDAAFQLGRIYYNEEKISEAREIFEKVIKVSPGNSNAHYGLGLIYEKRGDKKKALEEYKFVLSMNPENADVAGKINNLEKLEKDITDDRKENLDQLPISE